jgi:hypothetical protein
MFDFISIIFNLSHVTNTRVFSTFGEEGPIGKLNFIVMNKKNMIVGLLLAGGFLRTNLVQK